MDQSIEKTILVEGLSDKKQIKKILREPIEIICTHGTISYDKMNELVDELDGKEIYTLFDADLSGDKLRKQFTREFSLIHHLYIDRKYKEVATTPYKHLATVLLSANIDVHSEFLL